VKRAIEVASLRFQRRPLEYSGNASRVVLPKRHGFAGGFPVVTQRHHAILDEVENGLRGDRIFAGANLNDYSRDEVR
jgi:hypothetical protein